MNAIIVTSLMLITYVLGLFVGATHVLDSKVKYMESHWAVPRAFNMGKDI